MIIKAHIVHCVSKEAGFKFPHNVGSILVLVEKYGTKFWLKPEYIENYSDLNMFSPYELQDIDLIEDNDYLWYFHS